MGKGVYLRVENMALVVGDFGEAAVFGILPDGRCLSDDKRGKGREPDVDDVSMEEGKAVVSVEGAKECAGIHLLIYLREKEVKMRNQS